ncbi:hypothetical protein ACZ75_26880 [Massilia sp. NR 4-1]|nr:hypothetical protein ACZ75_26880 [Massilia sp. NR 4-1]
MLPWHSCQKLMLIKGLRLPNAELEPTAIQFCSIVLGGQKPLRLEIIFGLSGHCKFHIIVHNLFQRSLYIFQLNPKEFFPIIDRIHTPITKPLV